MNLITMSGVLDTLACPVSWTHWRQSALGRFPIVVRQGEWHSTAAAERRSESSEPPLVTGPGGGFGNCVQHLARRPSHQATIPPDPGRPKGTRRPLRTRYPAFKRAA